MPKYSRKRRYSDSDSDSGLEGKIRRLKRELGKLEHRKAKSVSSNEENSEISPREVDWRDVPSSSRQAQGVDYTSGSEEGEIIEDNAEVPQDTGELNQEVLALLGDNVTRAEALGTPLQSDLAIRWLNIIRGGLSDPEKTALIQKYPTPSNCQLVRAPKLNPLVADAISDSVTRRDSRLQTLQVQVGASISAIGSVLTSLLKEEGGGDNSKFYIQALSDAGRMLSDILHSETLSRRELAAYNLNRQFKGTLTEAPIDEWLFGANLEERVKAKKDMERTALQLKVLKTKQPGQAPAKRLNFRGPPRAAFREGSQSGQASRTSYFKNQGQRRQQSGTTQSTREQHRAAYRRQGNMRK